MYRTPILTSPSSITYNHTNSTYSVTFAGNLIETTVTDRAAIATAWVDNIVSTHGRTPTVVGLDVEWLPHPVPNMSNKSATVQLCVGNKCLILQLFYMDYIPAKVSAFLMNPNFTFVGIEVADDVAKLRVEYGLGCSRHADVREAAKQRWPGRYSRPGLKDLAYDICGLGMPKPLHVCRSNWEARQLSEAQVEYACIDAFASYKIGHKLLIDKY